jgi:hypothetical protein
MDDSKMPLSLRTEELRVDVLAHPDVVDQVPARVIWIPIDHELVTCPAPWSCDRPVIVSNLELAAGQPDTASAKVNAA